ncbi:MAG TPA: tetratricopeptide repeat protein [Pyrinomonadaceae bacterium]|nr:tetratricopeptide repeat protein [Pyrinomonadaceae bacterium]
MQTLIKGIGFVSSNWVVFLFLISILAVLIGRIGFGISIFQPLEEIAHRQDEYRRKEEQEQYRTRMVNRHIDLGNRFLDVWQLDAARTDFVSALKLDPLNIEAQMGLFKADVFKPILENDFDPEIAEKRLQMILRERQNDRHALLFLGSVYMHIEQGTALDFLQAALEQDSSLAAAYVNIGLIYDMQNKPDDALAMYEKAAEFSEWNQMVLNNLGYEYIRKREYEKAISKLELLLNLDDRCLIGYWNLSNAYRLCGAFDNAYLLQKQLIRLLDNPNVTSLSRNDGIWFFQTEPDRGAKFYDLSQKQCYSYYSIALTSFILGNEDEARRFMEIAQALDVDDRTPASEFLISNLNRLAEEQSPVISKLDGFRKRFLTEQDPESSGEHSST